MLIALALLLAQETFVGVGAQIDAKDGAFTVARLVPGGPAETSDLKPGDRILKVDGKPVQGLDLNAVVALIRGKAGSVVALTVTSAADPKEREIRIVRGTVVDDRVGLRLGASLSADGLRVGWIRPKSSAAEAGLQAGDTIVKIDGKPFAPGALEGPPGSAVLLSVRSPGSPDERELKVLREKPAGDLFDQALVKVREGKPQEAVDLLTKHLQTEPGELEAYLQRALAHRALGHYDLALKDVAAFGRRRPKNFPRAYFVRAEILNDQGDWVEAEGAYSYAITYAPEQEDAWLGRACCRLHLGRLEEAGKDFDEYEKFRPGPSLGRAQWLLRSGQAARAVAMLDGTLKDHPTDADALRIRGAGHLATRSYDKALEDGEASLKIDPDGEGDAVAGAAAVRLGRHERAVELLTAALKKHPENKLLRGPRAEALFFLDRAPEAVTETEGVGTLWALMVRAVLYASQDTEVLARRAFDPCIRPMTEEGLDLARQIVEAALRRDSKPPFLVEMKKTLDAAIQAEALFREGKLDEAIRVYPDHAEAHLQRARILVKEGKVDEAIADLDPVSRGSGQVHVGLLTLLGDLRMERRDYKKARSVFNDAWEADKTVAGTALRRGTAEFRMGNYFAATLCLDDALQLDPSLQAAWRLRGEARRCHKELAPAIADFEKALALSPADHEARFGLAFTLAEAGRHAEAEAVYQKVIDAGYEVACAQYNRAIALSNLKEYRKAREALDAALQLQPVLQDFDLPGFPSKKTAAALAAAEAEAAKAAKSKATPAPAAPAKARPICRVCWGSGVYYFDAKVSNSPPDGAPYGDYKRARDTGTHWERRSVSCKDCGGTGYAPK